MNIFSIFSDFYIQPNAPKATQRQPKTSKTAKAGWIIFAENKDADDDTSTQNESGKANTSSKDANNDASAQNESGKANTSSKNADDNASIQNKSGNDNNNMSDDDVSPRKKDSGKIFSALSDYLLTILHLYRPQPQRYCFFF